MERKIIISGFIILKVFFFLSENEKNTELNSMDYIALVQSNLQWAALLIHMGMVACFLNWTCEVGRARGGNCGVVSLRALLKLNECDKCDLMQ